MSNAQQFMTIEAEDFANRVGYDIKSLQSQLRRWGLDSVEKGEEMDLATVKSIIQNIVKNPRSDSRIKVEKANALHVALFGDNAVELPNAAPSESVQPLDESPNRTNTEGVSERPLPMKKPATQLQKLDAGIRAVDMRFSKSLIEVVVNAAPLLLMILAIASFFTVGKLNADYYTKLVGVYMGCAIAAVKEGVRFVFLIVSAKNFKEGNLGLGILAALMSGCFVAYELYEAEAIANWWVRSGDAAEKQFAKHLFGLMVVIGASTELGLTLVLYPIKSFTFKK